MPEKTQEDPTPLQHAEYLLKRRWSVIPLRPQDKRPLVVWEPYQKTLPTKEQVRKWFTEHPTANVGIVTGKLSSLLVLDVDGAQGAASVADRPIPRTPTVITAKGTHYYFRYPKQAVRNGVALAPGLDVRAEGGYVVAPPSRHPNGTPYRWGVPPSGPGSAPLAEVPEWLLALARETERATFTKTPEGLVPHGERKTYLASIAGSMRRRGMSEEAMYVALLVERDTRCELNPPIPNKEVQAIAKSIGRYPPEAPQQAKPQPGPPEPAAEEVPQPAPILVSDFLKMDLGQEEWLIQGYIPRNGLTLVVGDAESAKSLFTWTLALCAASGLPLLGQKLLAVESACQGLVVDDESPPPSLQRRLLRLYAGLPEAADSPAYLIQSTGWTLDSKRDMALLFQYLKGLKCGMLVLDNFSTLFGRGSQNDPSDVLRHLNPLLHIAHTVSCTVLLIDHERKSQLVTALNDPRERVMGSRMKIAKADSVLSLSRPHGIMDTFRVTQIKARWGHRRPSFEFQVEGEENGPLKVTWRGWVDAQDEVDPAERDVAIWVRKYLEEHGPTSRQLLLEDGAAEGHSERSVDRWLGSLCEGPKAPLEKYRAKGHPGVWYRPRQTPEMDTT